MTLSAAPWAVYEFDNSAADSVGNGPTLNIGGSTYDTGKVGSHCLVGDCDTTGVATIPNAVMAGDFSVAFWFKREVANNRHEFHFDNAVDKSTNFRVDRTGTGFYRMKTSNSSYIQNTTVAEDGAWHHAVFVYNGTQILYYMDGALQGTKTYSAMGSFNASPICYLTTNASAGKGTDQWAIFQDALTSDDITYLYNGGSGLAYSSWEITAPAATSRRKRKLTLLV